MTDRPAAADPAVFAAAYRSVGEHRVLSGPLTRGPWDPEHQHAGPPSALICRALEQAAGAQGLTHIARLSVNLIRPVPLAEITIALEQDYVGRNAAHFSGWLLAAGKVVVRFTALAQREQALEIPQGTPAHPLPHAPSPVEMCPPVRLPFFSTLTGYPDLVELRLARGRAADGPCAIWFGLRHPLVEGETPSPYQRVAVAADSGNGISAALDFKRYLFVNCDLTINLLRRPRGTWICVDARTLLGSEGCGLAESVLYDESGLIGRATQSLSVRARP